MASGKTFDKTKLEYIDEEELADLLENGVTFEKVLSIEEKRRVRAMKLQNSYDPDTYPALTKDEWVKQVKSGSKESMLKVMNEAIRVQIDQRMNQYNYNSDLLKKCSQFTEQEVRIVLVGKTGEGKSAVGNTILGQAYFKDDLTANSVTTSTRERGVKWGNAFVRVADTPGLQDTLREKDVVLREIARIVQLFPDGIHAFLYVLNLTHRFTASDKEVLDEITEQFGQDVMKHLILVLTHVDSAEGFEVLPYVTKEREADGHYKDFLQRLDWKVIAVNNKARTPYEQRQNQSRILSHIITMIQNNGTNKMYSNQLFAEAQKIMKSRKIRNLKLPLSSATFDYFRMNPAILDMPRIPDDLLQAVKCSCPEAKYCDDNELRVEISAELCVIRKKNAEIKAKVSKAMPANNNRLCTIL